MPASSIRPVTAARQHPSLRGPGSVRAEGGHVVGGRALAGSDEVAYGVSRREGPLPPSFRHPTREAGFSTRQTRRCSAMHESCGFEGLQTPPHPGISCHYELPGRRRFHLLAHEADARKAI